MGDKIQIERLADRYSSHTQTQSRPRGHRDSADSKALRKKLTTALVEVVAAGGDPRLVQSLALA